MGPLQICGPRISAAHFGAGFSGCEAPGDLGAGGVSVLPHAATRNETGIAFDAAVKALAGEDADLDLNHVEPTGVLGNVVELDAAKQAPRFFSWEGLIEGAGRIGRQIVEHDADAFGLGIMEVGEFAHVDGEVDRRAALGGFPLAPGTVSVEERE